MVQIKPGDVIAQRPDMVVAYRLKPKLGWMGGAVSVERVKPSKDVTLPSCAMQAGEILLVDAQTGVAGAQYRVSVGTQSVILTVSWLVPCRPVRRADGKVTGVSRNELPPGHVWIADPPLDSGAGHLVLAHV